MINVIIALVLAGGAVFAQNGTGITPPAWIANSPLGDGTGEIDTTLENTRAGVAIIQAATDTEIGTLTTNLAAEKAVVDSVNGQKVFSVRTSAGAWQATKGPLTGVGSKFTGSGIWRIDALGATVTSANDGTATQLAFAISSPTGASGTATLLSVVGGAIASDAANTVYVVSIDTSKAILEKTANIPYRLYPMGNAFMKDGTANAANYATSGALYTPAGTWTLSDSTDATNAGLRYLWIRAVPITAGATLTAN